MNDTYRVAYYIRFDLLFASICGGKPPLRHTVLCAPDAPAAMRLACMTHRLVIYAALTRAEGPEEEFSFASCANAGKLTESLCC